MLKDNYIKDNLNWEMISDLDFFLKKILEALDFRSNLRENFIPSSGINWNTEYFAPIVTADDRLRYLAKYITGNDFLSPENRVLNVLLSHFYGVTDFHRVVTLEKDKNKAYVDFVRLSEGDRSYSRDLKNNLNVAKKLNFCIWSKNELHTSLQNAGHRYAKKMGYEKHSLNIIEWLSSWLLDGTVDKILSSQSLKECCEILMSHRGIGNYYGYHGGTDQSTNPDLNFNHDEKFVIAGPGATRTALKLWPNLSKSEFPISQRIMWIRENQEILFKNVNFHNYWFNIIKNGKKIYNFNQDKLFYYTTEVFLCQYGVYCDLKKNQKRLKKRVISKINIENLLHLMEEEKWKIYA